MERLAAAWPSLLQHVRGLSRYLWLRYQENVPQTTQLARQWLIYIIIMYIIGNQLWSLMGMLLAAPLAAILRDLFKYIYLRSLDDPLSPEDALERVY